MLLPRILSDNALNLNKIGFFLHIPFPDISTVDTIPGFSQLLDGISAANLIGVHTTDYSRNLIKTYNLLNELLQNNNDIIKARNLAKIHDFPMGIDYDKFNRASETREVGEKLNALRRKYRNKTVILTVDRLDPTKAICNRVNAIDSFLTKYPQYKGSITMCIVAVPSRTEVLEYRKERQRLEGSIKRVNGVYGNKLWKPIQYFYKSVSFADLVALYKLADIAFIAPVVDGMNLVAKEYVVCSDNGVLILSKTAGAAQQLTSAILVDPMSINDMVNGLWKALNLSREDKKSNMNQMKDCVSRENIEWWANNFLEALRTS